LPFQLLNLCNFYKTFAIEFYLNLRLVLEKVTFFLAFPERK
jgi:hypothetical protein